MRRAAERRARTAAEGYWARKPAPRSQATYTPVRQGRCPFAEHPQTPPTRDTPRRLTLRKNRDGCGSTALPDRHMRIAHRRPRHAAKRPTPPSSKAAAHLPDDAQIPPTRNAPRRLTLRENQDDGGRTMLLDRHVRIAHRRPRHAAKRHTIPVRQGRCPFAEHP